MITNITSNNIHYNKPNNQTFKGLGGGALNTLNFLSTSPAIGACVVDLCSMVIPRTTIDFKNRGAQAGTETAIREGSSCFLHACVGLIGTAVGAVVSKAFNNKFNIKAHNIYANSDTIDYCADLWRQSGSKKEYLQKFVQQMQGLDGSTWKTVSGELANEVAESLSSSSATKGTVKEAIAKITQATSAQGSFQIKNGAKVISGASSTLLENAKALGDAFENVNINEKEVFNNFVSKLKSTKLKTTIAGLGLCAALCMSIQPINKLLTKKRTGKEGFVGVDGGPDKSPEFKAKKTAVGLAMLAGMHSTIGKPNTILNRIQFNGKFPTINQFKFLYGLTITSRLLSARDDNELREGLIKDSLGFSNWLIFGGMVSKLVARGFGKELINNPIADDGAKKGIKYAAKWIGQASVKSYEEILQPVAKKVAENGKVLSIGELFKNADKVTKSKVLKVAGSQIAGYLYSGIVLGVGIAKLNIAITNAVRKKQMKQQADSVSNTSVVKNNDLLLYAHKNNTVSNTFSSMMN